MTQFHFVGVFGQTLIKEFMIVELLGLFYG